MAPEIVSAEAVVDGSMVKLRCTLSEPRADRCGFALGLVGETLQCRECNLAGSSFDFYVDGLEPGSDYEWYAFVAAGESELKSALQRFATEPLPPEPVAVITDPVFKAYLVEHFDRDGDGEISVSEALDVQTITLNTKEVESLEGIEYFTHLDTLVCRGVDLEHDKYYSGRPGRLRYLDLSSNTRLRRLDCDGNNIQSLILPYSPWLEFLCCSNNLIKELDLSKLPNLRWIQAFQNSLKSLDFSESYYINGIEIGENFIDSIDVTGCSMLTCLNISDLPIKELDLSGCPHLVWLGIYGTSITDIDLSVNTWLNYLHCFNTGIASLDLTPCPKLLELKCWDCKIEELDISMLPELYLLECSPVGGKNYLTKLYVSDTQLIEGVTVNRSINNIPSETEIIIRNHTN